MAKNKKLELDEYDFDGELDLPDFDFGGGQPVRDDRSPTTKIVSAAAGGYVDSLVSGDSVRHFIKKSLPRGYGEALDTADHTAGTLKSLYNTTAKEVKPVVNEIKKTSQRLIPAADKVLPKRMAESFKRWSQSVDKPSEEMSREQQKEAGIQAELGEIFQAQAEDQHKREVESDAREKVRDGMAFTRHKDVLQNLAPMRRSMQELSEYQRRIGINYQRKSLELQLRSYYVLAETLEETKRQNTVTTSNLEGILKNTGLPEFVKLKNSERLQEIIRNRFINGIGDTLANKRRNFMANLAKRIGGQVQDKVRQGADQIRAGLGAYESLSELREMQAQFGRQQSGGEQAAEMVGGMLAQHQVGKTAAWLNSKLENNNKLVRGGNMLSYWFQNAPQLALQWAKSDKGIGKSNFGTGSGWMEALKGNIQSVLAPESTSVDVDKLEDVRNVDAFNRRTNRSITDIIPGYLARIYRELKILRTGDENQELVEYDYTKNAFHESSTVRRNILNKLADKSDKDFLKRSLDEFVNEIDTGKKLTPEQRRAMGRLMMENNLNGGVGDSALYKDANSEAYRGTHVNDAAAMAKVFQQFFGDDQTKLKHQVFARQFSNLGTQITNKQATIQDFVNLNQRHHLEALGLLDEGGNTVDMARLREYLLSDDEPSNNTTATPGRRVSRRRGEEPNRPVTNRVTPRFQNVQHPGVTPQPPTAPVVSGEPMAPAAVSEIVRAIEAANPTSALNDSNRLLAHIVQLLENGIPIGTDNAAGAPRSGRWWNRSVGGLAGDAWSGGIKGLGWLRRKAGEQNQKAKNLIKGAWDKTRQVGEWGVKKWQDFNDVYIEGEAKPRLLAWKLKAGKYYDQATGQVVKSFKDVTGAIVDENGNIVLSMEDARRAYERSKLGKGIRSVFGFAKRQGEKAWDLTQRLVPGIYGRGLSLAKDTVKKVGELLDQPQDIYIAGRREPILLAVTMRAGGYASRITSKEIRRPSEIDGPVVDERGDVVLTAEQLAGGLLNKYGQPLKTGYRGLLQRVTNFTKRSFGAVKNIFKRGKDWLFDKASKLTGDWSMNLGFSLGTQSRNQAILLQQIRDMLNDRLPGTRTTFAEEVKIEGTRVSAKKAVGAIKDKFLQAKEKLERLSVTERLRELREKMRARKVKAKDKMAELFEKYFGKKKILGDRDGDGIVDGSYRDLIKRQKEKLKGVKEKLVEKAGEAKKGGKSLYGAALAGGKSLWDRLRGKKKHHDDDEDDDDGVDIDIDAANDNDHHRRRRRNSRNRTRPTRGRGLWGKTKNLLARRGRGVLGAGKWLGGKALGLGGSALGMGGRALGLGGRLLGLGGRLLPGIGTAYGAYSTYENLKEGNYGDAAIDAGLTAGGAVLTAGGVGGALSAAGTVAGTVLGGLGTVLASPAVLIGLAVAAVGAGGYYGYKYLKRMKLDPYSTLRYAQYGFPATDDVHLQAIFDLEEQLQDAIVFSGNQASLDEKKVDVKKILSTLDIDVKDQKQLAKFVEWFDNRFKPVLVNSAAALKAVDPAKKLKDVGDLTPAQKRQYLNVAKFPGGPYNVTTSPFSNQSELTVGQSEVAAAAEMAEAALQKEEKSAPAGAAAGAAVTATTAAKALQPATTAVGVAGVTVSENPDVAPVDQGKINALAAQALPSLGEATSMTVAGPEIMQDIANTGRVDAMTAIRFRTYGLKEMESDKVRALSQLETEVQKGISISRKVASWTGSPENMIATMGSSFGVQGVSSDDAYMWINWFNNRFLPTYLAYVTAMLNATEKATLEQAKISLTPIQAVDVATAVYTAKGSFNGSSVSVWQVTATPWPGYELNADVKTTEGNFQSLKDQAKRSKLAEESANVQQGVTNGSVGSDTKADSKLGFFSRLFADRKDAQGKPSGNIFSRIYDNAKDMMGMGSAGREITHPGKGTGGDINNIPMPKGNGTYAALKDTLSAAAKMVGVDEKLHATMAAIESGFNSSIKAPTSSATGLFQFIKGTWDTMLKKYGAKYGIDPNTPPTDPRANALLGAEFIKENAAALSGLGRKLTDTDLYLAHFLGSGGAKKFLSASPDAVAANVLPDAARANPSIFTDKGSPLTVSEVYSKLNSLVRNKGKQFGLDDGSEKVLASAPSAVAPATPATAASAAPAPQEAAPAAKPVAIPVSDQAPMPLNGPAAPQAVAPTPNPAPAVAETSNTSATSNVDMMSYSSQRSRDVQAQQQSQRDRAAEVLGTTNEILGRSYDVQTKILDAVKDMASSLKQFGTLPKPTQVLEKPVEVVKPAPAQPSRVVRPMTPAPVSMAVGG